MNTLQLAEKMCAGLGKDRQTNTHEDGTNPDGFHPYADEEYNKRQASWLTVCNDFSTCTPILRIQNKCFPLSYWQQ
jgi:hypothetical protein